MDEQLKKQLRRSWKERGAALPEDYRREADRAIFEAIHSAEDWQRAAGVFLFVGMWAEPDTRPLLAAAFREGKRVYVPFCCPDGQTRPVRNPRTGG